ncbi:branched-chain amino acid transport system II carrier protein [Rummeliibacillus stabekisii]|uniref:branched-chain amino acid transport system II carrier protein n=1 Tax=Rummeliibacillus TaxID=648802 RepID=UPI001167B277|nr:branched-chain amino acid transport system II carrier protein [Rummeliibacillus stabekisii]MBB5170224.1 LIVCS family branched-chain amino acid:cation transporter [Rummeliibacillus stabekisii]GEL04482.1 branched-chain amino acid transport system carrier protein BraB [Rummeliibacillus stabekisii]
MEIQKLSLGEKISVGFMLFALFLGAGNIIFPPLLGQQSGEHFVLAIIGFLITGVGLPLLGVITVAKSGGELQDMASKVSPLFGIIFTAIVYLAIGPFFAMPRTGTVSYELGVKPYLSEHTASMSWPLIIFTILFFLITMFFALNPSKLIDRVGKILTPALLVVIAALAIKSIVTPMDGAGKAIGKYVSNPFGEGFVQGYLTMDFLAALIFGIVIIEALKGKNITHKPTVVKTTIFAAFIAAAGLALVYLALGYIGSSSYQTIGQFNSGADIITKSANILYGQFGNILLTAVILLACLTTSIGLMTASSEFFYKLFPSISYKAWVWIFAIFSTIVANIGLDQLIAVSLPVLLAIYPLAIVLMVLTLVSKWFLDARSVYITALIFTAFISIYDGLKSAKIEWPAYEEFLKQIPLYSTGIGWLIPALIGAVIGWIISLFLKRK